MRQLLQVLLAGVFALFAMPSFASSHMGLDPLDHWQLHSEQANFWINQGQWVAAFNQSVCTTELTWQTMFTHWIFTQGGGLWLTAGLFTLTLLAMFALRKKILQAFQEASWFLRFSKARFA
jgi:hypothetical protein